MRKYCSPVVLENFFEPCVLYLLLRRASYGYELFHELKNTCRCSVNIGNLYRKLAVLSKKGYIIKSKVKGTAGPDKTVYTITPDGKMYLKQWIANLEEQTKIIQALITNYHNSYVAFK